jgi:hypothetical protein
LHSIQYDSCLCYDELNTLRNGGNLDKRALHRQTPGYGDDRIFNDIWPKGIAVNAQSVFWNKPTENQYVVIRYGRALLNIAQSLLGRALYDASEVSSAVTTFNRIRTIHGYLPPSFATSLADSWHDDHIEGHVYVALEGDDYWSLLRWGMYRG